MNMTLIIDYQSVIILFYISILKRCYLMTRLLKKCLTEINYKIKKDEKVNLKFNCYYYI
jgi:hypothetical protein